ncbi:uncharacterized protein TNCV_2432041 [Trichonephila clavipes]|nr:uncharacterized protein TNCV_2432041 [Trichonephila clavipes]
MDSLKLVHPFTLILAGPSGSGKSQFVKKLIENKMIKPFPKNIIWCYGVYQALYEEMPNISFHEDATSKPYGYLLIDLKPETDESLRVRRAKICTDTRRKSSQVTEHLSELDQRMKNILHNKDLTEEEKTILYLQVLQKYTHFSNENRRESEPVPNAASLSENQETESLKENLKVSSKDGKEVFEDEIFRIVPARYKEKAKIFSSF